jgi:hypothetical protein
MKKQESKKGNKRRQRVEDKKDKKGQKETERGFGRRTFLKIMGVSALSIGAHGLPISSKLVRTAHADQQPGSFERCRIVVFGSDSLKFEYAKILRAGGAPALNALNPPICSTSGGLSCTQPGWASIWSALPSEKIRCWANGRYEAMPAGFHIVDKLAQPEAYGEDLYIIWITGKGGNIRGLEVDSPHHAVYELINGGKNPGTYLADEQRTDLEVKNAALEAIEELKYRNPENFICFIHFQNPDHKGHVVAGEPGDFDQYMSKARTVDNKIYKIMQELPNNTDIIYCSDHGFDFISQGDPVNGHKFSPYGMVATNFPTFNKADVSQMAIGRLIYKRAGGNPDLTSKKNGNLYRMFGEDLM